MNQSQQFILRYVDALRAVSYKVQLKNNRTGDGFWLAYTPEQLIRAVGYLRGQNARGYDIYARPVGWQFVLLDDLTKATLAVLKADDVRPCLLIETSPANYQAWVILANCPTDRETAKTICRSMASRYAADPGSAEPDHVGRLPGYTNRKPKYQRPNGQFPFVLLHRAEHRFTNLFLPQGGRVPTTNDAESFSETMPHLSSEARSEMLFQATTATYRPAQYVQDGHSEHDFGIVCGLMRRGWTDETITAHLLNYSPDLQVRKGRNTAKYIERTITAARKALS